MIKFSKVYIFLFFILVSLRIFGMWDNLHPLIYAGMILMELTALAGLYGMAFKKYIFRQLFWKIFVFVVVLGESLLIYLLGIEDLRLVLIFTGLLIPAYIYLYIYGYKTNWDAQQSEQKQSRQQKGDSDDSDRSSS